MRIRTGAIVLGVLLAAGCGRVTRHSGGEAARDSLDSSGPNNLAGTLDSSVYYRIRPLHDGNSSECLDVAGVSRNDGARIQQYACGPRQSNQLWRLAAIGDGRFQIVSANSGKCLDVTGTSSITRGPIANTENSALFQQWTCADSAFFSNQTFRLVPSGVQDYFKVQAVHSGRCMDITGTNSSTWAQIPNTANMAIAHQWDCAGAPQGNQLFRFEPVSLGKNVAYQKPVTSNVVSPSPAYVLPAANLTDGNTATQAYNAMNQFNYDVDLGSLHEVNHVRLTFSRYTTSPVYTYITAWELSGMTTAGTWASLAKGGAGRAVVDVPVGRTISKLRIAATGPYDWFGIYELEAFGNPVKSLFAGYQRPQNIMGIGDDDYLPSLGDPKAARMNKIVKDIRPGTRNRTIYWRYLEPESAVYQSQTAPLVCPAGFTRYPSTEDERLRLGYHRFRCLNDGWIAGLDGTLGSDRTNGIQSSVVIWTAPRYYTDLPNCRAYKLDAYFQPLNPPEGRTPEFSWGSPCVPRPDGPYDRMEDYQDLVTFLANRYSGKPGSPGKIAHYIVWNEANTQDWFDNSPAVNNQHWAVPGDPTPATLEMSANDKAIWFARYADMIRATYEAVRRHTENALIYASLTGNWANPPGQSQAGYLSQVSGVELIDALWANLGTRVEWSIALHAYGDNQAYMGTDSLTLSGQGVVIQHQTEQLFKYRPDLAGTDPALYPWVWVFNSEQGWQQVVGLREMAHQTCVGHNGATQFRTTVGETHFQFQRKQGEQDHYGQPFFSYGLVPIAAGANLENADYYNTYQAFKSTHPDVWGKRRNHFCCKSYGLGCGGPAVAQPGDLVGDGRADFTIFRPSNGYWHGRVTTYYDVQWGMSGDIPVDGDFNGDGKKDFAVFRPANGTWYINGMAPIYFGQNGDIPVVGDYNGDGKADIAVWRPSNGYWYIRNINTVQFGTIGDIPTPGDFNGDGVTDIAVFRPGDGSWYIGGIGVIPFGTAGDIPIAADYDGDGRDDLAVWRPSTGHWYVDHQLDYWHGSPGDIPVPADYDGDGRADLMLYRPATGYWHSRGTFYIDYHHGESTDIPILKPRGM